MAGMPDPNAPQAQPQKGFWQGVVDTVMPNPPTWDSVKQTAKGMLTAPDPYQAAGDMVNAYRKGDYAGAMEAGLNMPGIPQQGMFIGMGSPMFDKKAFRGAMELTSSGAGRNEIWDKTGNAIVPGNRWVQELSDHEAKLKPAGIPKGKGLYDHFLEVQKEHPTASEQDQFTVAKALLSMQKPPKPVPVPDILHHPQLMDAYPELRTMPVGVEHHPLMAGQYIEPTLLRGASLKINFDKSNPLDTALHEIQHHIQGREGWPKGGDEAMFMGSPWKERMNPGESAFDAYMRLAGEEMARATEKRRLLTPQERRQHIPDTHMDNPMGDQILRWR